MASKLKDFREQYPQYNDWTDEELATAVQKQYYPEMDLAEYRGQLGLAPVEPAPAERSVWQRVKDRFSDADEEPAAILADGPSIIDDFEDPFRDPWRDRMVGIIDDRNASERDRVAAERAERRELATADADRGPIASKWDHLFAGWDEYRANRSDAGAFGAIEDYHLADDVAMGRAGGDGGGFMGVSASQITNQARAARAASGDQKAQAEIVEEIGSQREQFIEDLQGFVDDAAERRQRAESVPFAASTQEFIESETLMGRGLISDQDGFPIDLNRPEIDNGDGTFSTERTVTVEADGRFYNIPTIVNGRPVSDEKAFFHAFENVQNGWSYPEYATEKEALAAAPARSEAIGNARRDLPGPERGAAAEFADDPINIILELSIRSLPNMAESIPLAAIGSVAGPAGFAVGLGAGSAMVEYRASFSEYLRHTGVDMSDARAMMGAAENEELMKAAHNYALTRSAVIGTFDAVTGGMATKTVAAPVKSLVARELMNVAAQSGIQMAGGAGQEIVAQTLTAGEGPQPENIQWGQVGAESVAELAQAPIEVGGATITGLRADHAKMKAERLIGEAESMLGDQEEAAPPSPETPPADPTIPEDPEGTPEPGDRGTDPGEDVSRETIIRHEEENWTIRMNEELESGERDVTIIDRFGIETSLILEPGTSFTQAVEIALAGRTQADIDAAQRRAAGLEPDEDFTPSSDSEAFTAVNEALERGVGGEDVTDERQAIFKVPSDNWLSDDETTHQAAIDRFRANAEANGWQLQGEAKNGRSFGYLVDGDQVEVYKAGAGMGWSIQVNPPKSDWTRATGAPSKGAGAMIEGEPVEGEVLGPAPEDMTDEDMAEIYASDLALMNTELDALLERRERLQTEAEVHQADDNPVGYEQTIDEIRGMDEEVEALRVEILARQSDVDAIEGEATEIGPALPPPEGPVVEPTSPDATPASWIDNRLKRREFRAALENMAQDLAPGGGAMGTFTYEDGQVGQPRNDIPTPSVTGRLPSENPAWFQSMMEDPQYKMSVRQLRNAVDKAVKGAPLGVRQARVVQGMLDEYSDVRASPTEMDHAKQMLQHARNRRLAARAAAGAALDPYADVRGEMYSEDEYDPEMTAESRQIFELFNEAAEAGITEDELERYAIQFEDNQELMTELEARIDEQRRATRAETTPAQPDLEPAPDTQETPARPARAKRKKLTAIQQDAYAQVVALDGTFTGNEFLAMPTVASGRHQTVNALQALENKGYIRRTEGQPTADIFTASYEVVPADQVKEPPSQYNTPWGITRTGTGDIYIQRIGPNVGTPSRTRTSDNDLAITLDQNYLLPDFVFYLMQMLQPQVAARARGAVQQYVTADDVSAVLTEHFEGQAREWEQLELFAEADVVGPQENAPRLDEAKAGALDAIASLQSTPGVTARSFSSDFAKNQRTSLVGKSAPTAGDLAVLAQVYRDPRFETLRVLFMDRDDNIVTQLGISARLPASAAGLVGYDMDTWISHISARAKKAGATQAWMLHNHPSGRANPSQADEQLTIKYNSQMRRAAIKLRGHIVIDENQYAAITPLGESDVHYADLKAQDFKPKGGIAGEVITGPKSLIGMIKNLEPPENETVLVVTTARHEVLNVVGIANNRLSGDPARVIRVVQKALLGQIGASRAFAFGRDVTALRQLRPAVVDSIHLTDKGGMVSIRETEGLTFGMEPWPPSRTGRFTSDTSEEFDYLRPWEMQQRKYGPAADLTQAWVTGTEIDAEGQEFLNSLFGPDDVQEQQGRLPTKKLRIQIGSTTIEVLQNPTRQQFRQMRQSIRMEYEAQGFSTTADPITRSTFDPDGNHFMWESAEAIHAPLERALAEHLGIDEQDLSQQEGVEEQQDDLFGDGINPKVRGLVTALNNNGVQTTMSGDLYADQLVYVDLVESLPLDTVLPAGWVLTSTDVPITGFDVLGEPISEAHQRQHAAHPEYFARGRRIARAGSQAVSALDTAKLTATLAPIIGIDPALAEEIARRDAKRNAGQDSIETGQADDMFSEANRQRDIEDDVESRRGTYDEDDMRSARVRKMSMAELVNSVYQDALTGVGNLRAYNEEIRFLPIQAVVDADSLKWINDNMGLDAGDAMLVAIAQALDQDGVEVYRIGGDEFIVAGSNETEVRAALELAEGILANQAIESEKGRAEGLRITYGIGATKGQADTLMKAKKARKERSGERAARGEKPLGAMLATRGAKTLDMQPGTNYVPMIGKHGTLPITPNHNLILGNGRIVRIPKQPVRQQHVLALMRKYFGNRIYEGRVKGKMRLGFYRPGHGEIRLKHHNDAEVAAHEVAHFLDDRNPWIRKLYMKFKNEMKGVSYDETKVFEGYAEFMRLFFTQESFAMERAPGFYDAWRAALKDHKPLEGMVYDVQELLHAWTMQGARARGAGRMGSISAGVQEKFLAMFPDFNMLQSALDGLRSIKQAELALGADRETMIAYEKLRIATGGSNSMLEATFFWGTPGKRADAQGYEFTGDGLATIFGKNWGDHDFGMYLLAKRAYELEAQGRQSGFRPDEIAAWLEYEQENPEAAGIYEAYQDFNTRMLDFAQQTGILGQSQRAAMEEANKNYTPFYRVIESRLNKKRIRPGGNPFMRLKGSARNVEVVWENIINQVGLMIRMGLINDGKRTLLRKLGGTDRLGAGKRNQAGGLFAAPISKDNRAVSITGDQVLRMAVESMGWTMGQYRMAKEGMIANEDDIVIVQMIEDMERNLGNFVTFFEVNIAPTGNVDFYQDGGDKYFFEIIDPGLWDSLKFLGPKGTNIVYTIMGGFSTALRRGVVAWPTFQTKNFTRDSLNAWMLSSHIKVPAARALRVVFSQMSKDPMYREMVLNGGGFANRVQGLNNQRKLIIDPTRLVSYYDRFMGRFENANRLAEYIAAREAGQGPRRAALLSRDISTDFAMRGSHEAARAIAISVPFLNARAQGNYRVARTGSDYRATAISYAIRGAALATATLALYALNKDDDRYKQLPEDIKDLYWVFFYGQGEDDYFLLPKPFENGMLWGTIPERMMEYTETQDGKEFADAMGWMFLQTFNMDMVPQTFQPMYDLTRNRDFTGAPIIPFYLDNVEPSQQYTYYTSETMKAAGKALGLSPMKMDYAARGYLGTMGTYFLAASDAMIRAATDPWMDPYTGEVFPEGEFGEKPTRGETWKENIVVRGMAEWLTQEGPPRRTKYVTDLYDMVREAEQAANTIALHQRRMSSEAEAFLNDPQNEFLMALVKSPPGSMQPAPLAGAREAMSEVRKQMDAIRADKRMTGDEKRVQLWELTRERNKLAREVMEAIRKAEANIEMGNIQPQAAAQGVGSRFATEPPPPPPAPGQQTAGLQPGAQ